MREDSGRPVKLPLKNCPFPLKDKLRPDRQVVLGGHLRVYSDTLTGKHVVLLYIHGTVTQTESLLAAWLIPMKGHLVAIDDCHIFNTEFLLEEDAHPDDILQELKNPFLPHGFWHGKPFVWVLEQNSVFFLPATDPMIAELDLVLLSDVFNVLLRKVLLVQLLALDSEHLAGKPGLQSASEIHKP